ncbi:hypothetical protein L3X38_012468 [Prunus dulcis]|uniref:Uncharacterized protein n=1 Tax=Prunus dulcis TaxID=3755 RepID=A0AAD4WK36_PRUDU|nr:hypothetical protein L3X38_012468 [Prunus dulcis]
MEEAAGEDEVGFWVLAEICSSDGVAKDWIWASTEKSSWRRYGLDRLHVQFPLLARLMSGRKGGSDFLDDILCYEVKCVIPVVNLESEE